MKRLLIVAVLGIAVTLASAGGDRIEKIPCGETAMVNGAAVRCGPCNPETVVTQGPAGPMGPQGSVGPPGAKGDPGKCFQDPPEPVKEIVTLPAPPPKPFWFVPVTALYLDRDSDSVNCGSAKCPRLVGCPDTGGFGGAVGLGYQWPSRVSVAGSFMYQSGPGIAATLTLPIGGRP